MKAEISMSQLWFNPQILGFFFTEQATKTLEELIEKAENSEIALEQIEDYANSCDMDADEVGDLFHEMDVEDLAAEIGIDIEDEEENE